MFGRRQTPKISNKSMLPSVVLIAIVVLGSAGFAVMHWYNVPTPEKVVIVPPDVESLRQEIERQGRVIDQLNQERGQLLQRIAKLERISQIDQESVSRVQDELKSDKNERLKLEEELLFLRSIVSAESDNKALHLQRLRLQPGTSENSVLYAFTVSKVLRNPEYIDGLAFLTLSGEQDGVKRSFSLNQVSGGRKSSLKLRFKHFQNVEGEFLLPGGFKPSGVTIEVKPEGNKFSPIKKKFEWLAVYRPD